MSHKNACDQLDEAKSATRQGLAFSTRAVAAPISIKRFGEGDGGSNSTVLPIFEGVKPILALKVNGKPLDARSDIYSMGVMAWHMLAGRPPFTGESALAVAVTAAS